MPVCQIVCNEAMRIHAIRMAASIIALAFAALAPAQVAFNVATLKLSPPPEGNLLSINLGRFQNGRFTMNNVTLSDAIKYAYEVVADAQLAGPAWNATVRFPSEPRTVVSGTLSTA